MVDYVHGWLGDGSRWITYEEPINFLPNFRNPCWQHRKNKTAIRCLPYFYLAGFPKCGTTDLYERIFLHPGTAAGTIKENYWMIKARFQLPGINSLDYYATNFFESATSKIIASVKNGFHHIITGDGTPSTIWQHEYWRLIPGNECCSEPRLVTAQYIKHVYPGSKFIVLLRDPTERLISDYFCFRHPVSLQTFELEVERVVKMYETCFGQRSERSCFYDITFARESNLIHLMCGLYYIAINDWLKVFPREQFLFIPFQDYARHLGRELKRVYSFLGLDPLPDDVMQRIVNRTTSNKGTDKPKLAAKTIEILKKFYRPFNVKLASLLADDRFLWF
ncbi:carbohydrate sulfotransferase 15-like [Gigantopelta aegis]|uniref:carbohydrate sulfotransferase 15-like n=1 Tax=Gigantopelta aegis TaxID=1735272 RepID=UPI001B889066|nr:carbohydrate sulfotransferase 15-like [Gigantopelta aegis]